MVNSDLERISKELDAFIAKQEQEKKEDSEIANSIRKRIEKSYPESNKDRKFQLQQTDIQIWISICLGCFALTGAFLIGLYQVTLAIVSTDLNILKEIAKWILLGLVILFGILTAYLAKKAWSIRGKMEIS
jgi:hypothetical protein